MASVMCNVSRRGNQLARDCEVRAKNREQSCGRQRPSSTNLIAVCRFHGFFSLSSILINFFIVPIQFGLQMKDHWNRKVSIHSFG